MILVKGQYTIKFGNDENFTLIVCVGPLRVIRLYADELATQQIMDIPSPEHNFGIFHFRSSYLEKEITRQEYRNPY